MKSLCLTLAAIAMTACSSSTAPKGVTADACTNFESSTAQSLNLAAGASFSGTVVRHGSQSIIDQGGTWQVIEWQTTTGPVDVEFILQGSTHCVVRQPPVD